MIWRARWLSGLTQKIDGASDVRVTNLSYPLGAGMSHETILFDAAWRADGAEMSQGMVVRIKPTTSLVYCDDMFDQQYRLIQLMHANGAVRVAKPLWFEADDTILGAPFFVMEKVAGRVAVSYPPYSKSGWLVETAPADRRRLVGKRGATAGGDPDMFRWRTRLSGIARRPRWFRSGSRSLAAFQTLGGPQGRTDFAARNI